MDDSSGGRFETELAALLARSSLGAPSAAALRALTPPGYAETLADRTATTPGRTHGGEAPDAPAHPGEDTPVNDTPGPDEDGDHADVSTAAWVLSIAYDPDTKSWEPYEIEKYDPRYGTGPADAAVSSQDTGGQPGELWRIEWYDADNTLLASREVTST